MRYNSQSKFIDNADYTIYNPLSVNWKKFKWEQGFYRHFVSSDEIYKFYLIPLIYYGTVDYEDIILLLNNVATEFDMYPGAEIRIPKLAEVEEFMLENSQG